MHERTPIIPRKVGKRSAAIEAFHDFVAERGCIVCGAGATIHHVTGHADRKGRFSPDETCVAPLCPRHHHIQFGPHESVEALSHQGFYAEHGVDLEAEADALFEEWLGQRKAA